MKKNMKHIYKEVRCKRLRNGIVGLGSAAAVVAGGIYLGISTPVLAENAPDMLQNIPVLRQIFETVQEDVTYSGDYSDIGVVINDKSVTNDGVTITPTEYYCDTQAMYIGLEIKSEEVLPELSETSILSDYFVKTTGEYSFNPSGTQYAEGYCEGEQIDDYTYIGVLRIDLNSVKTDTSAYEAEKDRAIATGEQWIEHYDQEVVDTYFKTIEIPDEFTVKLSLNEIVIDECGVNKVLQGPWEFTLDIVKDTSNTQVVEINGVNEEGIGIEKIVKDQFEITLYEIYPFGANHNYFPVMLDADGEWMQSGEGSVNTVPIGNYDISHVDVYMIDEDKWLDNGLKTVYWNSQEDGTYDAEAFKELLLEECGYHTEVTFER